MWSQTVIRPPEYHIGNNMASDRKNVETHKTIAILNRTWEINLKGLSRAKSDYLSRLLTEENVDILILQETHAEDMK